MVSTHCSLYETILYYTSIVPPAVDMLTATKGTDICTSLEVNVEWDEVDFDVVCLLID